MVYITKRFYMVLLVLILLVVLTQYLWIPVINASYDSTNDPVYKRILWPMYKYNSSNTGFYELENKLHYVDYEVTWVFQAGLCIAVAPVIADVNNDGFYEVVFASCDGNVYCVDSSGDLLWSYRTGGGLASPVVGDFDGDNDLEIGIGSSVGKFWIINASNGVVEGVLQGFYTIVAPASYDLDNDGVEEIIVGDVKGYLHVIDYVNNSYTDKSTSIGDSLLYAPSVDDLDGNGVPEIVVGTSISTGEYGSINGILAIVDPLNLTIIDKLVFDGEEVNGGIPLYDLDGDGVKEIVFTTKHHLYIYNYAIRELVLKIGIIGVADSSPSIGDFDNDSRPDILVTTSKGFFVYSIDGTTIYEFPFTKAVASPIVTDIDGDGFNEALIPGHDGKFIIIDYSNGIEYILETQGPLMAPPAIGDIDNDGIYEIIIGSRDFNLYCIKGVPEKTLEETTTKETTTTETTEYQETIERETSNKTTTTTIDTTPPKSIKEKPVNPLIVLSIALIILIIVTYLLTHKR